MSDFVDKIDFTRLETTVKDLSVEFHDSKKEILDLSKELAKETARFSVEIHKLSEVLDEMREQMGELIKLNIRSNERYSLIKEVVLKIPRFITITFFSFCFLTTSFFTSHRDIIAIIKEVLKACYGV